MTQTSCPNWHSRWHYCYSPSVRCHSSPDLIFWVRSGSSTARRPRCQATRQKTTCPYSTRCCLHPRLAHSSQLIDSIPHYRIQTLQAHHRPAVAFSCSLVPKVVAGQFHHRTYPSISSQVKTATVSTPCYRPSHLLLHPPRQNLTQHAGNYVVVTKGGAHGVNADVCYVHVGVNGGMGNPPRSGWNWDCSNHA